MDKEKLIGRIKQWITTDDEIKRLQRQIKEKRVEKKEITETLVEVMRNNEIDCFDLDSNGGKLIYTKKRIKQSLSKKHLMTCLMQYFKEDSNQAKDVSNFILNNRAEKIKENIRRKMKK
jgi:hypothetical protein